MFVVILRYVKPLAEVERLLEEHRRWLSTQYEAGHLLVSGPQRPRVGGVLLAVASSSNALRAILSSDPFFRAAIAEYDVIEFQPTMADPRFDALLDGSRLAAGHGDAR